MGLGNGWYESLAREFKRYFWRGVAFAAMIVFVVFLGAVE